MFKKLLFVFLLMFFNNALNAANAAKVLILYDQGADKRQPALTEARYLTNLLGHFDASVSVCPVNEYKTGAMAANDIVFYVNYEKKFSLPETFKSDFYKNEKTFCWINNQIGELDQQFIKNKFGFHFKEYRENTGFNHVTYKNTNFPKGDDSLNIIELDNPSILSVVSNAVNDKNEQLPYIIKSKNLWFIADSPFSYFTEQDRYLVFCDLLHDILEQGHPTNHYALVRIEDINATTDPKSLLRIAKYLKSKNVPFAVSLVPVYVDSSKKIELHLEDKPKLLSVLKKIPSLGGTFIMHGYTHQYHGVSTDDYEFWDDVADKPVRGDSVDNVSMKIEKGLKALFENNIYPFAWETPHYFASKNTYLAVKKHFSIAYERRGTMPYLGSDQFFPYVVKDMYGQTTIPENLGYLEIAKPDPASVLGAAKLNLAVRDGVASFFYHPFIDISYLKQLIKGIKSMGYEFKDIKTFAPEVIAKDKAVLTRSDKVNIDTSDKFISVKSYDFNGVEKTKSIKQNTTGKGFSGEINCPEKNYVVVKSQGEMDPGFIKKIWRLAKTDLSFFKDRTVTKSRGELNKIVKTVFINYEDKSSAENNNDQKALKHSLKIGGINFSELNLEDLNSVDLRDYDTIVLPYAAANAMNEEQVHRVKEAVSAGSDILFDGITRLNDELGIELQTGSIPVRKIRDYQFPEVPLFWPKASEERPIYNANEKEYRVICVEEETNLPLVVNGRYGKGRFIYFSTLFDPYTDKGYTRYPFLIEMLNTAFDIYPLAERKTVEMYFDPGMRQYISTEKLVKLWKKHGVNRIYAAGWHFYDKYTYDYGRLLKICHQNGILVYCWLEPPMVNQKFWNKYPLYREKTALLKDAKISWRYLMNLADEKCRNKVFVETEDLLMKYDWDGVNLAELYFESSGGPAYPENFTPMNADVRKEFKARNGFDPIDIFNQQSQHYWKTNNDDWKKFAVYRRNLCNRLKIYYLDMLARIKAKKVDFEIMLTAIDATMTPELEDNIAEDTKKLIALQKVYGITVQMEDPAVCWTGKPERYYIFGQYYRNFIADKSRLILDCNVLDNHRKGEGGLPAEKPTGEEIRQITYNMALTDSRLAFYSEETLFENDYKNITSVLARDTVITQLSDNSWRVKSPNMITINTGKKGLITQLDDEIWFAGEGDNVIVPAGEHILEFKNESRYFDMASLKPRLMYISGELKWANFNNNNIEFSYSDDTAACYIIVNKRPGKIYIDNKKVSCHVYESDNGFSIKLPSGTHVAKVNIGGGLLYLVESSGIIIFSLIFIFGFFTSVLLLVLFIIIQIKRKLKL